jgi:4'-phosphopantetheinyl transferase
MTLNRSPIALSRAEIHLWLTGEQLDLEKVVRCRCLLSFEEKQREVRFHFEKDRTRYLVTRALVRSVLSRYEVVDPADWVFLSNAYGRPEIDVSMAQGRDLCFSVSHTAGLIVLGVTRGRALGVDVENLRSLEGLVDIAKQVFATTELAELADLPAERQLDRFFQYWTLKEAYIKARGTGCVHSAAKVQRSARAGRPGRAGYCPGAFR